MNNSFVILMPLICLGCGSLQTLPPGSAYNLNHNERYENTHCDSIPRVYSGISLDVCLAFIGPPASMYENHDKSTEGVFYAYTYDMLLSFTVDTLALPYTITRQIKDGNLRLKRKGDY